MMYYRNLVYVFMKFTFFIFDVGNLINLPYIVFIVHTHFYVPPLVGRGGIVFGTDPVGID